MALDPRNPDSWRRTLGLLPVPLVEDRSDRFVFLNGSRGNFCLETIGAADSLAGRDIAWSADVGHYLRMQEEYVEVQRWDTPPDRFRRVPLRDVVANPQRFHAELEQDEPTRDAAIVPHFMGVFRRLRTSLDRAATRRASGTDALQAFLYLLAVAATGAARNDLDAGQWALGEDAGAAASRVPDEDWDTFVEMLTRPRRLDDLRPLPDVVLRHVSGMLFQEAHYQTVMSPQLDLFAPAPARLGAKEPASIGVHFTPAALARALVEETLHNRPAKQRLVVFDPACGSGEFLREASRQLRGVHNGPLTLVGWDASPAAVAMAKFVLAREAAYGPSGTTAIEIQVVDDSLSQEHWPEADILLMNPPFLAWNDLSSQQRERLRQSLGAHISSKPDLASAFLLRAVESLSPDGTLGAVVPASMLDGRSAAPVRQEIADRLSATLVARLGSHDLFAGARVDAALYVAARRPKVEPLALWADHRPASASRALRTLRTMRQPDAPTTPASDSAFSIYPRSLPQGRGPWSPRPYKSWKRLERLSGCPQVGSLFDVRQGVLTGLNQAFVLPAELLRELPRDEQRYFRPAVVNESIADGQLTAVAFVFYPYDTGGLSLRTQAQLEAALPRYFSRFLKMQKDPLSRRGSLRSRKWWELVEPRASWQPSTTPRLMSTYFGSTGSFAFDPTGRFVVVQGYAWEPRGKRLTPKTGHAYVALLSAPLIDELLGAVADHVGGGQWNLSQRFVKHLPLPDLFSAAMDSGLLADLGVCGRELARGRAVEPGRLDELALAAYGLLDI